MKESPNSKRTRRFILIMSGATDVFLGVTIALTGFGFFPIDISNFGVPLWLVILIGGVLFASGTWMVIYNYSRMDE